MVPHLASLGISHLYASPIFAAAPGSMHGYNVVDPTSLNPELGSEDEFVSLVATLHEHGMGLLLDIVPNHMAAVDSNPWWMDVLRHGRRSEFASFFDIDWDAGGGKVLLPVLGGPLPEVMERSELRVRTKAGEPYITYHDQRFPVAPETWRGRVKELSRRRDQDLMWKLLERQHYRLAFWRRAAKEINYRRFFDVTDLISIRPEDARVFAETHRALFDLIRRGSVDAVRIDHVDGLLDPSGYLDRLARRLRKSSPRSVPVLVEKILARTEPLPREWPTEGTTGYEWADLGTSVLLDPAGAATLERWARDRSGAADGRPFGDVVREKKRLVLQTLFPGEVDWLAQELVRLAARAGTELEPRSARTALVEVSAALPVYRTYTRRGDGVVGRGDARWLRRAFRVARRAITPVSRDGLSFLERVLLLDSPRSSERDSWVRFVMRWQRLTGPATAKGLEDTALYNYDGLLARADVGADPADPVVGVDEFHAAMAGRHRWVPNGLNATSTHDSKRSEDVRARLAVLSEIPDVWMDHVERWSRLMAPHTKAVGERVAPDPREQDHIFQSVVGAWPLGSSDLRGFGKRIQDLVVKMAREAKRNTSWLDPDEPYERALVSFVRALLAPDNDRFRRDVERLMGIIALPGALNGLSQTLLKMTTPGIPDFYQGSELWHLALVDPDNRRPVRFGRAVDAARDIDRKLDHGNDDDAVAAGLLASYESGAIKLHVIRTALGVRHARPEVFERGAYVPLNVAGRLRDHVIAFARRRAGEWVVVVVPRLTARLIERDTAPIGRTWDGVRVELPGDAPPRFVNALTNESVTAGSGRIRLPDVFRTLPLALLVSQ